MTRIVQHILSGKYICFLSPKTFGVMYIWRPLGLKKEFSKETIDLDLDNVILRLCSSFLANNLSIIG